MFDASKPKIKGQRKIASEVFDDQTLNTLVKLANSFYFDILEFPISTGKEANVFRAKKEDGSFVAIKIYRYETSSFRKMWKEIANDPRLPPVRKNKRSLVHLWAQREFKNLLIAKRSGVRCPQPIKLLNNVLVMEFIGVNGNPAPLLVDAPPEDPESALTFILSQISLLYKNNLVHGDISEFNILNNANILYLIDFSQATTLRNPRHKELLIRDISNVCKYFSKLGVNCDTKSIYKSVVS